MRKMFYTFEEAREKLGKSSIEIKELVNNGRLQQFRDMNRVMFRVDQIDLMAGLTESMPDPFAIPEDDNLGVVSGELLYKFKYQALNKSGRPEEGIVEAKSNEGAILAVKDMGFFPTSIRRESNQPLPNNRYRSTEWWNDTCWKIHHCWNWLINCQVNFLTFCLATIVVLALFIPMIVALARM